MSIALLAVSLALTLAFAASSAVAQTAPDVELAERYAPVLMLKHQPSECDTNGEQYMPAPIEIVYGDPDVVLKAKVTDGKKTDPVTATGPTAEDLARADKTAYLDFPGNPRDAGCAYERHAKARMAGLEPTIYAHIGIDQRRGMLALQYWFFYYFNLFNNTHESDWEMITLVWDTTSVEEALRRDPVGVGYAQHGRGELAEWDDKKLEREGTHPIVYAASGSHASYFGSNIYIGWGENGTGFGCDDTTGPSVRVTPRVVLVPDRPDAGGPLAWALFQGRWGERQPWQFDGPKGPNLGKKWSDPIGAIEDWHERSLSVPGHESLSPTATDLFCDVTSGGSQLLIYAGVYPWLVAVVAVALVAVPAFLIARSWRLLAAALRLYGAHLRAFVGIGLLAIPIGWAVNGFGLLVTENPPVEWLMEWFGDTEDARLFAAGVLGAVQQLLMLAVVAPAVVQAIGDIRAGRRPEVARSFRVALRRIRALVGAVGLSASAIIALSLTMIGVPIALWLFVRWQFFAQAAILDDAPTGRAALGASARAVRRHWWTALGAVLAFQLIGALPGPVIGIVLLIVGGVDAGLANGVSSFIYAITIPISVIALTLVYLRFTGREWTPSAQVRGAEAVPAPDALRPEPGAASL